MLDYFVQVSPIQTAPGTAGSLGSQPLSSPSGVQLTSAAAGGWQNVPASATTSTAADSQYPMQRTSLYTTPAGAATTAAPTASATVASAQAQAPYGLPSLTTAQIPGLRPPQPSFSPGGVPPYGAPMQVPPYGMGAPPAGFPPAARPPAMMPGQLPPGAVAPGLQPPGMAAAMRPGENLHAFCSQYSMPVISCVHLLT